MNSDTTDIGPERWAEVEDLFERASSLPADERETFLLSVCGDDQLLLTYLQALLNADSSIDDAIEKTVVDTMNVALASDPDSDAEMRGEMIGPYRVERLLGSGGMGMVYLAARDDDQFEQQVAIKLGRHRLVDPHTKLRLRSERQILANLDHPNIARLYDGGTTDQGVPYLVMEYIDGVRIDTFCDQHRLSLEERMRLFQTICAAVHYAHQNLIIHRDIKSSNILVTADGTPKLLDFGIAKLVDAQGEPGAGLTREGAVILTPEAASPEQLSGRSVTTASDTYALGQLLYLLLAGVRSHDIENTSPAQLANIICRMDTLAPSERLTHIVQQARRGDGDSGRHLEQIAENRGVTIERLLKRLRGDIDTIILKTLRKEPERRYGSVSALAEDIGLHLNGMPIVARAESWQYRTGKFVRRHLAAVSAAVAVVGLLIAFSIALSIQNERAIRERDRARDVSRFLEDIFMTPDPANARGASITAREILAEGAARIETDLQGNIETQSALMGTIGRVYFNLGEYQPSLDMLEKALQMQQTTGDAIAIADAQSDLAATHFRLANYQRAEELIVAALSVHRSILGEASDPVARNLSVLAEIYLATGRIDDAQRAASASVSIYAAQPDSRHVQLAESKNTLARVMQTRGDLTTAEQLKRESIDILAEAEGQDHPLMPYYLQSLGVLLRSEGDLDGAEETLNLAIESSRRILGEDHELLAAALFTQGTVLHAKGDLAGAEATVRDALASHVRTHGQNHPRRGYYMTLLGMLQHDDGRGAEAEQTLHEALDIFDDKLDRDHQYVASAMTELGAVLNSLGRANEALPFLEEALLIRLKDYPDEHVLVASTRAEFADALIRQGQFVEARPLLQSSRSALAVATGRRLQRLQAIVQRYEHGSGKPL